MNPPETPERPRPGVAAFALWVRRWLVALLVGSYALATVLPGPGLWLRGLGHGTQPAAVRFSLVMVSVLLFCGGASIELTKLRELARRPRGLLLALAGVWAPPLLVVGLWGALVSVWLPPEQAAPLAIGLAMAGSMPVANSAVAWTHQSGGALVWSLGLVVLSISVCPWVAPAVMRLMGLTLSGAQATDAGVVMSRFTGLVFVVWVLGPTLLGVLTRRAAGAERLDAARPALTLTSAAALLLLNYANAAAALPNLLTEPDWRLLATAVAAASTLPLVGSLAGWQAARMERLPRSARSAWAYSLGMKNTGLALGLTGATLGGGPIAVLTILAVTLTQHIVAGVVHLVASRGAA